MTAVAIGSGLAGLLAAYASRRRVRDVVSVLLFIPLMLGGLALSRAIASFEDFLAIAPQIARGAAWTPFGAGPAAAWAVAEGRGAAGTLEEVRDGRDLEDRFVDLVGGRHGSEGLAWL